MARVAAAGLANETFTRAATPFGSIMCQHICCHLMARVTCKKARRRLSFGSKVDQAFDSDSVKLVMEIPPTNEREALNHREPNQSAKPVNGKSTRKWHSSASGSPYFDNSLITNEFTKRETRKCSRSPF